jgi:hypothetical protein
MLLDLKISGRPVTGKSDGVWRNYWPDLIGVMPPSIQRHGNKVELTWLEDHIKAMADELTQEQLFQYFRAYVLYLLGKIIVPDTSGNRIHNMYLPLLEDMDTIKSYSWGSALLAQLYRGMCGAAMYSNKKEVS